MELLREKIELLNQIDENWLCTVKAEWDSEKPAENKELVKAFREFFAEARNGYKENETDVSETLSKYLPHSADWVLEEIRKSLQVFFSMSEFRNIDDRNHDEGRQIIDYCFSNVILRFDPQFAAIYEEFGFETLQSFIDTARNIDGLVGYYVARHWTESAIIRDLKDETGLKTQTCEYIASNVEKNYNLLQMNVMLDMMHED